jgi:dephospho-CoA kinase
LVIAGLTGGIASGKSTVSAFLENAGAVIVDADKIARKVVRKNRPAWREIVRAFGQSILLPDGEINRILLGEIVFNDPAQKQVLNRIVHPGVFAETATRLSEIEKNQPGAVVILDVPLLIESGMDTGLSDIIVVYVPESVQIQRLITRDAMTQEQALARIRSQMPIEEKKKRATIVIDNSGSLENTRIVSLRIYHKLCDKNISTRINHE